MHTPVLLIHFNRPDHTRRQLQILETIRPSRIWVVCDGPRSSRPLEAERVEAVRKQFKQLSWPCSVKTLFRDQNLGVCANISSAISWFFESCESGIILEDDCLPDPTFFPYCSELLDRYADDSRVFTISGYTGRGTDLDIETSYCFSNYFSCWGWATWRRAWQAYDPDMTGFTEPSVWRRITTRLHPNLRQQLYWRMIFNRVLSGRADSWAYRFLLSMWLQQGLAITPRRNMVENCGFGAEATNTGWMKERETVAVAIDLPLKHPRDEAIVTNEWLDHWIEDHCHSKSFPVRVAWLRRKLLGVLHSR